MSLKKLVKKMLRAMLHRAKLLYVWVYIRSKPQRYFTFQGKRHPYACSIYNNTWRSERAVEVPLVRSVTETNSEKKILEVGNVLRHYYHDIRHDVLDKYEAGTRIIHEDVVDFKPKIPYDVIVSISTMEHVGWDEHPKNPEKLQKGLINLYENCLAKGGVMVVTMPIGYNKYLDALLQKGNALFEEQYFMKKVSAQNEWEEASYEEVKDVIYGHPYFFGNAIMVGIVRKK